MLAGTTGKRSVNLLCQSLLRVIAVQGIFGTNIILTTPLDVCQKWCNPNSAIILLRLAILQGAFRANPPRPYRDPLERRQGRQPPG
jgi:hypothetical protein